MAETLSGRFAVHAMSRKDDWETPPDLFARLNAEFSFTLDAAATAQNAKCRHYLTVDDDGLVADWGQEIVWLNPPYGREIGAWMRKAYQSSRGGGQPWSA